MLKQITALLSVGWLMLPAACALGEPSPRGPATGAAGEEKQPDKSQFTLWNPTPSELLREMEALYRSPYTVDAGHVQIETYALGYVYGRDRHNGADVETEIWRIAPTTLKLGVLNTLELEVDFAPHTRLRTTDRVTGQTTLQSGFGDITPKAKLNLLGNDAGSVALALMPYVKLPTSQDHLGNGSVEGGLVLPMNFELPGGFWFALSPEVSFLKHPVRGGYSPGFGNVTYLWHEIVGTLSGYVEFSSWVNFGQASEWVGTADVGFTYMLTRDLQLDTGVLVGVTRAAPEVNPFLGVSIRF